MRQRTMRLFTTGAVLAFVMVLTGCGGDGKKAEPKVAGTAPNLEQKSPSGGGPGGKGDATGVAQ